MIDTMSNMKRVGMKLVRSGLLLAMALGVYVYGSEEKASVPTMQQGEQELREDARITQGKLKSGLRYIIRPTSEPVGRGSVRLYVHVGSLSENELNTGFSHLLEHMVFNGSRNYKRGELIPVMQKLGLGFGGDANAYTSFRETVYMLDLPNLQEKTVDTALTIMRDFADGATLDDEAIDKERGIVISELKARDSASMRATVSLLEQLSEGTRLAKYMPIGKEKVLRHGSAELVRKQYKDFYVPENMVLILTGDFEPKQAETWINKHFSEMQATPVAPMPELGSLSPSSQPEKLIPNEELADCNIIISVVRPFEKKPDSLERRAADLPLQLACEMLNRRLKRLAHTPECPFKVARTEWEDLYQVADLSTLSVTTDPAKWRQSLSLAVEQLRQAMQFGFDPTELQEATGALMANLRQARDTWETMPASAMADLIVRALSDGTLMTDPGEDIRAMEVAIQRIMQNPESCRQALEKAFDLHQARLTLMGNLPNDSSEQALREIFEQALAQPVEARAAATTKPFAYDTIGVPGVVLHREDIQDLGITTLTLSNGVKVNLKPIDFRKGSIRVTAAVNGGRLALPDTPGLTQMVRAVMQRGGLQEHSYDELESIFASKRVSLDFDLTSTRFVFTGLSSTEDLELQCKLLAASILYPGYREDGELLLRRSLNNEYRDLETTPNGVYGMQSRRALFGKNTLFVVPQREEIEALSAQSVREVLSPLLEKNFTEVSLVGDFDVDEIIPILERTFGAMPQRRAEPIPVPDTRRRVEFQPWGQREIMRYPTDLDKTIVAHVHYAGNGRDLRRNRRLHILSSIVRDKLFNGLRANMGESYSPSAKLQLNPDFDNAALLTTVSFGVKGNRTKVSAAMESICTAVGRGDISDDDFERAKRPIVAAMQKSLVSPDYWEENLIDLQSDPQRLPLMRDFSKDIQGITADEIRALGREVFGKPEQTNFYFVVPQDTEIGKDENQDQADPNTRETEETPAFSSPAEGEYVVLMTKATAERAEWKAVADALLKKYAGATLETVEKLNVESCAETLRRSGARYAAIVLRPEEVNRATVDILHRATRKIDDDPYGDCLWGIISGSNAKDALRIAQHEKPLIITSLLSTMVEPDCSRMERSFCMTEKKDFAITERHGYDSSSTSTFTADTPEGLDVIQNGLQPRFSYQLSTQAPQLIVAGGHGSPFSLEMPSCKGLIFSADNRFHQVGCQHLIAFASARQPALEGKTGALQSLAEAMHFPIIEPDETVRVWVDMGPGERGDVHSTTQSMVITALSAYGCNQFSGYTVPSWHHEAAQNTLQFFLKHTDETTLAEAFYLGNQLLIARTLELDPKLLNVQFNDSEISPTLQRDILQAGAHIPTAKAREAVGLVQERDILAFFGDPAWVAAVDSTHTPAPLQMTWNESARDLSITARSDFSGPAAALFPKRLREAETISCSLKNAIITDNFILIPSLSLKKGESITIHLTSEGTN